MNPIQTILLPDDVDCPELAYALRTSLGKSEAESQELANDNFREAMSEVIQGIQRHGRFDLLRDSLRTALYYLLGKKTIRIHPML
jgi:hypothetical protein